MSDKSDPPLADTLSHRDAETGGWLDKLNAQQRIAVCHGTKTESGVAAGPQLVIAGAGTGKTATLCHRVAWLVLHGVHPDRIGLLTFSRRAADEMARRAGELLMAIQAGGVGADEPRYPRAQLKLPWAGTFHSICARLLRQYATLLGLNPAFSIVDRSDAVDLMGWIRDRHGLSRQKKRFPGAATCLNIYSDKVNGAETLADVLAARYPWCQSFEPELSDLFAAYIDRKLNDAVLDYDDLLLWCCHGLEKIEQFERQVSRQFDHILIDEFQDCNTLQMRMLLSIRPSGDGIYAVGDDAQSIYSFRAARVELMYEFERCFDPPARLVTLHDNYRSTQAILNTSNALMANASGPYKKSLHAAVGGAGSVPVLAIVADDAGQAEYVIDQVLLEREAGTTLKEQSVLFRSAHHSDVLELALSRRNIPYVKHGGLKFIEAAHVRDYLALLRWSQNPNHHLAAFRSLQLLPGVGPVLARRYVNQMEATGAANIGNGGGAFGRLSKCSPPANDRQAWESFCSLMLMLNGDQTPWVEKLGQVNQFVEPLIERRYDGSVGRLADLQVLNTIAQRSGSPEKFLSDMALDPPNASGAWSDQAHLDEDYLILSTVHSAKGQEWKNVFVLNVADGNFPNEYATGNPKAIEEERRLLYVAMTRAKHNLHLVEPQRYYLTQQPRLGGAHVLGLRSRFLDKLVMRTLRDECPIPPADSAPGSGDSKAAGSVGFTTSDGVVGPDKQPVGQTIVADSLRVLF